MRSFEQRMTEIRRRSDVILRKRKKRQRAMLALSVPLVLCAGLLGLFFGGNGVARDEAYEMVVPGGANGIGHIESSYSYTGSVEIRVTGNGKERIYKDSEEAMQIAVILFGNTDFSGAPNETVSEFAEGSANGDDLAGGLGEQDYQIRLIRGDGSEVVYRLNGDKLIREDTQIPLNTEKLKELKVLLGIQ